MGSTIWGHTCVTCKITSLRAPIPNLGPWAQVRQIVEYYVVLHVRYLQIKHIKKDMKLVVHIHLRILSRIIALVF